MKKILKTKTARIVIPLALLVMIVAAGVGMIFASPPGSAQKPETAGDKNSDTANAHSDEDGHNHKNQLYICPMMCIDPQPKPGRCPVCSMDLVPMPEGMAGNLNEPTVIMSLAAQKLAHVETAPVTEGFAVLPVRFSGKVGFDETREKVISAWVPGRLEKVYVDNTGTYVKEGQPLVEIYSKKLNGEKAIYLSTLNDTIRDGESKERRKELNRARLKLMGLAEKQIDNIEKRAKINFTEEILAPISGTVISKNAKEGMYVTEGQQLYTVADLSRVWVWLDAYEIDLPFIRYGQEVEIIPLAIPGHKFKGMVSFIEPVLNNTTRTAKVRVQVKNENNLLKPNMIVRAVIKTKVGKNGAVVAASDLEGKWICPRHPEEISDKPGICPESGLKLVKPQELGYYIETKPQPAILAPANAILFTGKRGFAYKAEKDNKFRGVEVELGPRAGDYYIINSGLEKGDNIAVNGAFRIDSALQLSGRPSMMRRKDNATEAAAKKNNDTQIIKADSPFRTAFKDTVRDYFKLQYALGADNTDNALTAIKILASSYNNLPDTGLTDDQKTHLPAAKIEFAKLAGKISATTDIEEMRKFFEPLSKIIESGVREFGPFEGLDIFYVFCPMAFKDKGAYWLQETDQVHNPYEGKRMRKCGFVQEQLSGTKKEKE